VVVVVHGAFYNILLLPEFVLLFFFDDYDKQQPHTILEEKDRWQHVVSVVVETADAG
jgi:hypothetical protein